MKARVKKEENIEVFWETQAIGLYGEKGVEGMTVVYRKGTDEEEIKAIPIDGFFLAIGQKPNTDIFDPYLELDDKVYNHTAGNNTKNKLPGVFAAGDVADPNDRQAVTAAGSGCKAAIDVERYLVDSGK